MAHMVRSGVLRFRVEGQGLLDMVCFGGLLRIDP